MNTTSKSAHATAELQIPWLVNGTLTAETAASVREHLARCPQCQRDYQEQLQIHQAMSAQDSLVFAAEPSFQKLLSRLKADAHGAPRTATAAEVAPRLAGDPRRSIGAVRPAPGRARHPRAVRWLAAAAVVQALGLGLMGWAWYQGRPQGGDAAYVTLTSAPAPGADVARARIYFQPQTSLEELGRLLRGVHARVIDGPSETNVYTVGFTAVPGRGTDVAARLAGLRASPAVVLAEPLAAEDR